MEQKPVSRPIAQDRPTVGVIDAISAGFDTVLRHSWLMIIPIVLDLFLWIGPRVQAGPLYDQLAPSLQHMSADLDTDQQLALQEMRQMAQEFLTKFNLFSWLSVGVVGVPAVNAGIDSTAQLVTGTAPPAAQVSSLSAYFLLLIGISAIGLLIAGFFWAMLSGQLRGEKFELARWLKQGAAIGIKLVMFGALMIIGAVAALIPVSFLTLLISAVSVGLASLMPALLLSLIVWALFYFAFTAQGVALYQLPLRKAMQLSALTGRACFMPTMGLIGLSLAIYVGLSLIWGGIAIDSWLRLIAIIGNAFVATSLALASLVYYRNRSAIVLDRLHWPQPLGS